VSQYERGGGGGGRGVVPECARTGKDQKLRLECLQLVFWCVEGLEASEWDEVLAEQCKALELNGNQQYRQTHSKGGDDSRQTLQHR